MLGYFARKSPGVGRSTNRLSTFRGREASASTCLFAEVRDLLYARRGVLAFWATKLRQRVEVSVTVLQPNPATLVLSDTVDWSLARRAILRYLTSDVADEREAHLRIRAGQIMSTNRMLSSATYSPFVPDEGRSLKSYGQGPRVAVEHDLEQLLKMALRTPVTGDDPEDPYASESSQILRNDTLSFSSIHEWTLEAFVDLPEVRPHLVAYGPFDPDDSALKVLLWDQLVPVVVLSRGRILEHLEDEPEFDLSTEVPTLLNPTPNHLGQAIFYESDDHVFVDERALGWEIPPPLAESVRTVEYDSPVGTIMSRSLFSTTTRLSPVDDPDAPASVSRSLYFHEFPNPNVVESKVKSYLLAEAQPEQKWLAFADHGFVDRGDTALVLASLFSSVFFSDFVANEVRPTADGALQFTVPVLLKSHRGYLPLATSWVYRDSGDSLKTADLGDGDVRGPKLAAGVWLSTAYPDRNHDSHATPLGTPFNALTSDWAGLDEYVEQAAKSVASRMRANAYSTSGWLWIPRGTGRQRAFYEHTRSHHRGSSYSRKHLGGQVTALDPLRGLRTGGESEVSSALRLAQVILGIAGIRSHAQLHFD